MRAFFRGLPANFTAASGGGVMGRFAANFGVAVSVRLADDASGTSMRSICVRGKRGEVDGDENARGMGGGFARCRVTFSRDSRGVDVGSCAGKDGGRYD